MPVINAMSDAEYSLQPCSLHSLKMTRVAKSPQIRCSNKLVYLYRSGDPGQYWSSIRNEAIAIGRPVGPELCPKTKCKKVSKLVTPPKLFKDVKC